MKMTCYKYMVLAAAVLSASSCVREEFDLQKYDSYSAPVNLDIISPGSSIGDISASGAGAEVISLSVVAEASSAATKASRDSVGKPSVYKCEVKVSDYKAGSNPMTASPAGAATKTIYDSNSSDSIACNFLRLDEDYSTDHTALYTYPTWSSATLLEGEITGSPDNSAGKYRSVVLRPEQSYKLYSQSSDSIFYHTRMVGWHPMVCSLPEDGKPVNFGHAGYSNYLTLLSGKYGIAFDHALDGSTDLMMSNLCEGQRWHDPAGTNIHRDIDNHLSETYRQPFGVNTDQSPTYSNAFTFKHYLCGVRIWAKLDQSSGSGTQQGVLNVSTWGKIEALTFVDQPSTCTIMFPDTVGKCQASVVSGSWTDFTNFEANPSYMFGVNDLDRDITDQYVSYPVDMTSKLVSMDSTYLGYSLVMPGDSIIIAIQTSAGTYQATLPDTVSINGVRTAVFKEGYIYDVVLNLETKGQVSDFIENEDTGSYKDLSPWNNINSEFETANCYMIDSAEVAKKINDDAENLPGYCFLGTTIGNGDPGILQKGVTTFHTNTSTISPSSAKLVWQSESGLISNVHLQHGYVRFQVAKARKGNAVLAALDDDGTILWSWHIWITDPVSSITPPDSCKNSYAYMDRNLGAIKKGSTVVPGNAEQAKMMYGLYYQWGRKDPIPGPLKYNQTGGQSMRITPVYNTYNEEIKNLGMYIYNQGETIEDGIQRPMHYLLCHDAPYYNYNWLSDKIDFLWGEEQETSTGDVIFNKSIYDPCPYGYHVPGEEIQFLAENAKVRTLGTYGQTLDGVFLPYAGYYGPDRNHTANDAGATYCGTKGDYQGAVICSEEDGSKNSYFRYHRMRTYLSQETSWTESNVDGQASFTYNAPNNYVTTSVDTHHDYANRNTAAPIRCIKSTDFVLKVDSELSMSTRKVSAESNTTVTFTVGGRTNKGTIKSAVLYIYYTDSGKSLVTNTYNLADYKSSVTFTSKTVYGSLALDITSAMVSAATNHELYARLDVTVSQGGTDHVEQSKAFVLSDTFHLTIEWADNSRNTGLGMAKVYGIDAEETCSLTLSDNTTSSATFNTTKFVQDGNMFPPVVGQGTTVTVYVNSNAATVSIGGKDVTQNTALSSIKIDGDYYYPYTRTGMKWTELGYNDVEIVASYSSYKNDTLNYKVPVYGIKLGTAINSINTARVAVSPQSGDVVKSNWYIFKDNNTGYMYFNGLNFHVYTDEDDIDYTCLMGFKDTNAKTYIYNGRAGTSYMVTGSERQDKLQCSSSGTAYTMISENSYIHIYSNYERKSLLNTTIGDFWHKGDFDEFQIRYNYLYNNADFTFYPVTFTLQ